MNGIKGAIIDSLDTDKFEFIPFFRNNFLFDSTISLKDNKDVLYNKLKEGDVLFANLEFFDGSKKISYKKAKENSFDDVIFRLKILSNSGINFTNESHEKVHCLEVLNNNPDFFFETIYNKIKTL